ncbi:minor capsid protein [Anaerococcus sp. Marseille-Q5996]|uniref:minor capsid protein n=1 Tax=Anaerococcus sp. Marseille-Q5996 TaxID=2972769 RepID=UPI0021C7F55F|nr:minor capsid protein [Anaerococcus sp. Marseille-Q5996]
MAKTKKKYWKDRSEQKLVKVLRDAEKTLNLVESQYRNASYGINKDIKKLYAQFAGENNLTMEKAMELIHGSEYLEWRMTMDEYMAKIESTGDQKLLLELNTLAMRSRITRLEALNAEIMANVALMTDRADKNISLLLTRSLENTYYENMYDEYKDRNPKVYDLMSQHNVGISKAAVDRELKLPWSGANYSTNLWNNADYIAGKCQKLVAQNIIAGTSIDTLTKEITKAFGKNYRAAAQRLIITETAYVKNRADMLTYEKLEIEEYEILATLDTKTSEICQNQDGKHYKLEDAVIGENYPPFHPHCRSTTVKYDPDTEDRTRIARDKDGKNVTVPYDMKYKEWREWIESNDKPYEIITENTKRELDKKDKHVGYMNEIIIDGKKYVVDDKHVVLDPDKREKEIGQWLVNEVGGSIEFVPRVLLPQGVSTPDYLWNGESWDLKQITKKSKNTITTAINKAKNQTDNIILDLKPGLYSDDEISNQLERVFMNNRYNFLNKLLITESLKLKGIYKRKQKK